MINFFCSPCCYKRLITVSKNYLQCKNCKKKYENNNYPDLRKKFKLYKSDKKIHEWYKKEAHVYDKNLPILFKTFYESEKKSRNFMISKLENIKNKTGLEVGCGTGRDTELLLKKIGFKGKLYAFDFSKEMLDIAKKKKKIEKSKYFCS